MKFATTEQLRAIDVQSLLYREQELVRQITEGTGTGIDKRGELARVMDELDRREQPVAA